MSLSAGFIARLLHVFLGAAPSLDGISRAREARGSQTENRPQGFFVGISLLAASKTADAITTRQVLNCFGLRASENDPVFGPHPSPATQAGVNAAFFAGQVSLFHYTERSHHRGVKWLARANNGFAIEEHTRLAACNAGLSSAQSCHQLD